MRTLRRFIQYYKPYRWTFFLDLFCATLVSLVDLVIPLLVNYVLKSVFPLTDKPLMFRLILQVSAGLLALYGIRMLAQYYVTSWGHVMGARMEADLRGQLFGHLEQLSFSFYDKNNTGQMMSRLMSDLFDVVELAHHGPEDIFISIIKLTGSFIILLNINGPVTLVLLLITVAMLFISLHFNRRMQKVFMDNRRKIADVNAIIQDSLSGIRTVKSFCNEDLEQDKFDHGNQKFLESRKNNYLIMGRYFSTNGFMQGLMYLAVICSGGLLVMQGRMPATDIIIYFLYIGMFLDPVNRLVNFTEQFQKGLTGFQRMLEILDTAPETADRPDAADAGQLRGDIAFSDVTFAYEADKPVLNHIDLHIPAGRTLALVGPSGAGKSTFCSLLPRFYDVTQGAIRIDSRDVREYTLDSLRRNIGVVQQDVYIFNSTVRDNIAYGKPDATDAEIEAAARQAHIHDFITGLDAGYQTLVGERGIRFSGGQKQRIAIARVFLKNPPILILDEATSSLDNESEMLIRQALTELSRNRTTLIIAHRLSTVKNADEIIVLTEDGLAEHGSHAELLQQNGIYARLYNLQFEEN